MLKCPDVCTGCWACYRDWWGFSGVLSVCLSPRPGTHHTQETGPGPELHIKHTGNTQRKPCLNPSCTSHSLLHPPPPPDPRGRLAAKTLLHTQLTACLISLQCVQSPTLTPRPRPATSPGAKSGFWKAGVRAEITRLSMKCLMDVMHCHCIGFIV